MDSFSFVHEIETHRMSNIHVRKKGNRWSLFPNKIQFGKNFECKNEIIPQRRLPSPDSEDSFGTVLQAQLLK